MDSTQVIDSKYIPVVGLGGCPEAKKLIDQGFMTGTAVQDSKLHAKAIYDVAINLASGEDLSVALIINSTKQELQLKYLIMNMLNNYNL